jgi:hypothetical protein
MGKNMGKKNLPERASMISKRVEGRYFPAIIELIEAG